MGSKDILVALRRIMRAADLHSKKLERQVGLTVPQILIMQAVHEAGGLQVSEIARSVNLSQGTVTAVLSRLEGKKLLNRGRVESDRRVVRITLTALGEEHVANAPELLQEAFLENLRRLEPWEQSMLTYAVQRIAALMDAQSIDAAPILQPGEVQPEAADDPEGPGSAV